MSVINRTYRDWSVIALTLAAVISCEHGAQAPGAAAPSGAKSAPRIAPSLPLSPAHEPGRIDWPVPTGWEHETIQFPLEFARLLPYRGVEELRFAPGFYDPKQPGYWSYDIVWWLTGKPVFDASTMELALTTYFRGLSTSVGRGKHQIDSSMFRAELVPDSTPRRLTGRIFSMDAFTTGMPITLNAVVELRECVKAGRHAVTLMLSPRGTADSVWYALRSTAAALVCE
jgi:hypothetical protein